MKNTKGHKDIVEARRFIFEQMVKLSEGEITLDEGIVQAKLAHQLMEGYKAQVRFLEVSGAIGSPKEIKNVTRMIEA